MTVDMILTAMDTLSERLYPRGGQQMGTKAMAILVVSLLIVTSPLELSQVAFALVGAVAYALIQGLQLAPRRKSPPPLGEKGQGGKVFTSTPGPRPKSFPASRRPAQPAARGPLQTPVVAAAPKQEFRQPSSQPIAPLSLRASSWDSQVDELLSQISPTPEGDRIVQQLAEFVRRTLAPSIPEVEVTAFASGDLLRGTAFGVAVPEVDIVVSATPQVLAARIQGRSGVPPQQIDMMKLRKSAIRACTDRLVSSGNFKFRRSAFRGQEPKVTLLAPSSLGIHSESIPIDFSVNSTTPLHNAALLMECGRIEPRAKALILLVKRWAKDRGVCHAAKGHLSPYAWTLLTMYFLQVGLDEEGPLLPPLGGFEHASGLLGEPGQPKATKEKWTPPVRAGPKKTVGSLFKELITFYCEKFDFRNEAISIRQGKRAPAGLQLPLHVVIDEDGSTSKVAPTVEDPFDPCKNLADCATSASLTRLHEELSRARELCECHAPLTELLEPWVPPERSGEQDQDGELPSQLARLPAAPCGQGRPAESSWRARATCR